MGGTRTPGVCVCVCQREREREMNLNPRVSLGNEGPPEFLIAGAGHHFLSLLPCCCQPSVRIRQWPKSWPRLLWRNFWRGHVMLITFLPLQSRMWGPPLPCDLRCFWGLPFLVSLQHKGNNMSSHDQGPWGQYVLITEYHNSY